MATFESVRDAAGRIAGMRAIDPSRRRPLADLLPEPPRPAAAAATPAPARGQSSLPPWLRGGDATLRGLAIGLAAAAILIALLRSIPATPHVAPAPTILPTAPAVLARPSAAPVPTLAPALAGALRQAIVAYDAPGGAALGAIEPGRNCTPTGAGDGAWVQLACAGSGQVWTPRAGVVDLSGLPALPTAAPREHVGPAVRAQVAPPADLPVVVEEVAPAAAEVAPPAPAPAAPPAVVWPTAVVAAPTAFPTLASQPGVLAIATPSVAQLDDLLRRCGSACVAPTP